MKLIPLPESEVTSDTPERETRVEDRITSWAKRNGWWCSKYVSPGKRGVPDRVFIRKGIVVFIEVKRPGKEPTRQQYKRHDDMRAKGANVYWADNHEDAIRILASFDI